QCYPHVEQPLPRISSRGQNPGLMQLSIGRLDGKPLAIRLPDPVEGWRLKSPEGVDQVLLAMPMPLTTIVAAFDTDRDAGRPFLSIVQGVGPEAAALPGQEHVGPAGSPRIVELAAPADHGHQERVAGC